MSIWSYEPTGFIGNLVSVEADIRRGIPGTIIVGLPGSAVKEARERVRVAIKNSGFQYPASRILINLAPGGVPKSGTLFDLPIALALLSNSGQFTVPRDVPVLAMGEVLLSGKVRPVRGILPAVAEGLKAGIKHFIVPNKNIKEALVLRKGIIGGVDTLTDAIALLSLLIKRQSYTDLEGGWIEASNHPPVFDRELYDGYPDFSDLKGQFYVKRAMQVAAAGGHNVLLFGPPGSGKTMTGIRFPSILPDLSQENALEVTRIHSLAGLIPPACGIIIRPPYRAPHHSASPEGIVGGGICIKPGEISLAHSGVLFLDETPEFKKNILQNLREPLEEGSISIVRVGKSFQFPADFQLILSANPCPCGNLGKKSGICVCSMHEVNNYWKRIGGALMDRIDIRIAMTPPSPEELLSSNNEGTDFMRKQVEKTVKVQKQRYKQETFCRNGRISPGKVAAYCRLSKKCQNELNNAVQSLDLSARAVSSVLKVARTAADLDGAEKIGSKQLFEAIQYRRYGDSHKIWETLHNFSDSLHTP